MKVLVTGAEGFIGKNLISQLKNINEGKLRNHPLNNKLEIYEYDRNTDESLLDVYTRDCDFVFHLAGVNRPKETSEFMKGNFGFTSILLDSLKKNENKSPVLITSSTQAELDNPYGISKKAGEDLVFSYGLGESVKVLVYRLPNVFGKWCRPNYNSAVATFCNNIANGLDIKVNDPNVDMKLVYIDDVVNEFIGVLLNKEHMQDSYGYIPTIHRVKLGEIVDLLYSYKKNRNDLNVPNLQNSFEKVLYSTYLSYLPADSFSYPLKMNIDDRGSFTEMIKTLDRGQVSVNISKPGIVKGNHWHHTKNEKFIVVSGEGVIRFRRIDSDEVHEYFVSGDNIEVVDIPTGYTHNIENLGKDDLVTIMWANELFDPNNPDTYYLEV